jgi:hypothetical protein
MPDRSYPVKTSSLVFPVWLREDLPREAAAEYWRLPHAEIVRRLPGLLEYVQHLFSATDHGFWPSSETVGTRIPASWRVDGFPEVRLKSTAASLTTLLLHMREVFFDEQNLFDRVLGQPTGPRGGRWWTDGFDDMVGHRVALLLRRRRGVWRGTFCRFVHERIGPALLAAGAQDLRTYTFLPWSRFAPHPTPGISHDNPTYRRYHGAVVFGTENRAAVDDLLGSAQVAALVADQHTALTAVHAFSVERSVPVIRTLT